MTTKDDQQIEEEKKIVTQVDYRETQTLEDLKGNRPEVPFGKLTEDMVDEGEDN